MRETWQYYNWDKDGNPCIRYSAGNDALWPIIPKSDKQRVIDIWKELSASENYKVDGRARDKCWRPSIFMPRWASRLTLEITDVRVERLKEISETDAEAEGIFQCESGYWWAEEAASQNWAAMNPIQGYKFLWESINGFGSWDINPFIWILEFKVYRCNADALIRERVA